MLVITEYIAKHELKPLRKHFTLEDLLEGAKKVLKNINTEIKSATKMPGYKFFKVRIGKRNTGRMIVFMQINKQKVIPILIRLKKDKIYGTNMAMNNPAVVTQINNNLSAILEDILNKRFAEFEQ